MGYVFIRTGVFRNAAAVMAGLPLAKEIAGLAKAASGSDARVMVPAWSGCPGRVSWVMNSETLNGFHELLGKVGSDPKYVDAVRRLSEHIDGTLSQDQVWREVPTAGAGKASAGRYSMVRSMSFKNLGAMAQGLPVMTEMSGHILKTQDVATRIYVPVGSGAVSRALMVRTTDDLDKAQATMDKVMADDGFRRLLPRLIECVEGSMTQDSIWRVVE
jgi:hypothetical protein